MSASTKSTKRRLLIAGQNETVRRLPEQDDIYLGTVGLMGCIAVIIAGKSGKASLTHVDSDSDLSFILDEISLMEEEYTIDIIKNTQVKADLELKVLKYLEENGLSDAKSSYKNRVVETKEGTVQYNHRRKKPQVFSFSDFKELATPGVTISDTNRLNDLGYGIETSAENPLVFQLRVYTRQLNQALSSNKTQKPLIAFDGKNWQSTDLELYPDVIEKLKHPPSSIQFFDSESARSYNHVYPRYLAIVKALEQVKPSQQN